MTQAVRSVDVTKYPGVDWDLCLNLTGNNHNLAEDLLNMFADSLPEEVAALQTAFTKQDYAALKNQAHRMHGALCYCGIPSMKEAMLDLEKVCISAVNEPDNTEIVGRVAKYYAVANAEAEEFLRYVTA